jgi:hypothetical protein
VTCGDGVDGGDRVVVVDSVLKVGVVGVTGSDGQVIAYFYLRFLGLHLEKEGWEEDVVEVDRWNKRTVIVHRAGFVFWCKTSQRERESESEHKRTDTIRNPGDEMESPAQGFRWRLLLHCLARETKSNMLQKLN